MPRKYRMSKRAEDAQKTRDRIIQATMLLHDEHGVAATSYPMIAERAGIAAANIYRHFPTRGDLVRSCGMHVWAEMQPPVPDTAPAVFAGIEGLENRLVRLVDEIEAFYARRGYRLGIAARDRGVIPEIDAFLTAVEAGIGALVREALRPSAPSETAVAIAISLIDYPAWAALARRIDAPDRQRVLVRLITAGLSA
jgi:AcrR family transcriptional regulator